LSPESSRAPKHEDLSSSPMLSSSPSEAKLVRMANGAAASRLGKPGLQGLGAPSASFLKRPRRPVLSAMVQPYDHHIQSAFPILSPPSTTESNNSEDHSPRGSAPMRRAFSAFLPPSVYTDQEPEDEESSFEVQDMSSPAQAYSKRQQVKTIRRCDGTEDFRPLTGATAMVLKESPSAKFMAAGLPGFGDNEAHGKILPCHRVTEDGLMRIKGQTVWILYVLVFEWSAYLSSFLSVRRPFGWQIQR
jgi:M-phase inducer tyrosine phosphatase